MVNTRLIRILAEKVQRDMLGRMALEHDNAIIVARYAARDGDHLEIGTLHGGSAILVALTKQLLGFSGKVVCIDPLDGYYKNTMRGMNYDPITQVPVSLSTLQENVKRLGVTDRIEIIQARSIPWPIRDREFETAYIDGNHWDGVPMLDWLNVRKVTRQYVAFDNCDPKHPDVVTACECAKGTWLPEFQNEILCVVKHD